MLEVFAVVLDMHFHPGGRTAIGVALADARARFGKLRLVRRQQVRYTCDLGSVDGPVRRK
jgi:hypothetical protein